MRIDYKGVKKSQDDIHACEIKSLPLDLLFFFYHLTGHLLKMQTYFIGIIIEQTGLILRTHEK